MDARIERHAETLIDHSARVEPEDMVQIVASPCAEELVIALYERLGEVGARPRLSWLNSRANQAYLQGLDPDDVATAEHALAAMEETDVHIVIQGHENTAEHSDTPAEVGQAVARAGAPIRDALPDRDVLTQYPAPGDAQQAEMSTTAYEEFVWSAINQDWEDQQAFQEQVVDRLDPASDVHLTSGDTTDLTLSVEGMNAINGHGRGNLPDGEVFTAPVVDSVDGTVQFDYPVQYMGRRIEDVSLTFERGEVVDYRATTNEETLTELLETDKGARQLGEFGIGMNRDIDRFIHNILFDEKMAGTIHLALGSASDRAAPDGGNESAVHVDMLIDMTKDAMLTIDGEVVQRDGTFVFEEGSFA